MKDNQKITPLCPHFGICGGCQHQNISYAEQLKKKDIIVQQLFHSLRLNSSFDIYPIIASPQQYHYRHRIDLSARRYKDQPWQLGFYSAENKLISIESCAIAMNTINEILPNLANQLPVDVKHRRANITIKSDSQGHTRWGGIGRRSCSMKPNDYFFIDLNDIRIFYSLESFFQANLSILPLLNQFLNKMIEPGDTFYDLYGGVGLFSFMLHSKFNHIRLIETSFSSCQVAQHTISYNQINKVKIYDQTMESFFKEHSLDSSGRQVAMIDPPRKGLSEETSVFLKKLDCIEELYYLSCNPETLVRDLNIITQEHWKLDFVQPIDFFPQTQHIEILVKLSC